MTRRESSAVERALARLNAGGVSITDAAAAESIARSTLIRALRRRDVPPAPPGRPPKPPPEVPEAYYFADGTPLKASSPAQPCKRGRSRRPK